MAHHDARSSMKQTGADASVGAVYILLGIGVLFSAVFIQSAISGLTGSVTGPGFNVLLPADALGPGGSTDMGAILTFWIAVVGVLLIASGAGIVASRRWAFSLGLLLNAVFMATGAQLGILGAVGAFFCVWRLVHSFNTPDMPATE